MSAPSAPIWRCQHILRDGFSPCGTVDIRTELQADPPISEGKWEACALCIGRIQGLLMWGLLASRGVPEPEPEPAPVPEDYYPGARFTLTKDGRQFEVYHPRVGEPGYGTPQVRELEEIADTTCGTRDSD